MAPTQMKLRVRRRGPVAGEAAAEGSQEEERTRARSSRKKGSSRASTADASPPPPGSSSVAEDASPDSKCPICLDRFNNLAYLDRCLHRFCFPCIQEWSHNKAECPLCKQPFASILHSVRAEDDFKEYTLQPAPNNSSVAATVAMVAAMASAARSNHQMRFMLRRHRGVEPGESRRRRRRERRGRPRSVSRTRESVALGEWYLDSSLALPPLPQFTSASPVLTDSSDEADGMDVQHMSDGSPDAGVIFEGMMRLGGVVAAAAASTRRMRSQLAARRRMQQESGTARPGRERETVAFRRDLYRCGIRVSGIQGQPQQHGISADSFRRHPELLDRLRPWLRRELTVLYGTHGSLVDIIQRIIMARLARHGLEDTPTIEEELRPFLLARTEHFLHELLNFARSPLSLENYDLQAVYEPPDATQLEAISSSSDRESIIAISEGEEEQGLLGGGREWAGGAGTDLIQTRSSLGQSAWDDETPGPSHSAPEPSHSLSSLSFSPTQHKAANEEAGRREEEEEEEEEECLIVGYKKPIAERTPELVQLSSDSEEEEKEEHKLPVGPSITPPLLHLPIIPPSTSGMTRKEQEEELKEVCEQTCSARSRSSWCGPEGQEQGGGGSSEERRGQRRSSALLDPSGCTQPAIMHRRSPSPSLWSGESSPPDSSWEHSCSQGSRLPSSVSWSSSPPHLSEHSPPPPGERGEKPGGKRKYKSRHLDSRSKEPWRKQRSSSPRRERRRERRKERRRRRPRQGRRRQRSGEGGGRKSRDERSPSVEIIYEGPTGASAAHPPARKRRRKQERRSQAGRFPVIITLDSDGSQDGVHAGAPQQTPAFSELLQFPGDTCPTSQAEGGELPAERLTQGFHTLDQEPPRQRQNGSEHHVDVETMEGQDFLLGWKEVRRSEVFSTDSSSQLVGPSDDGGLLASILGELQVVTQPQRSFTCSSDGRPAPDSLVGYHGNEGKLPPLLRQVSPVRAYSRNTPPPLKRSDAPSPRPWGGCASAVCFTSHRPPCPPGCRGRGDGSSSPSSALQPAAWAPPPDVHAAPSLTTSTEHRKQRPSAAADTAPGGAASSGVSHQLLEHFVPSSGCGTETHHSPVEGDAPVQLCPPASPLLMPPSSGRFSSDSSCRRTSTASGAALDKDAPSLGHGAVSGAPVGSTLRRCGAGAPGAGATESNPNH